MPSRRRFLAGLLAVLFGGAGLVGSNGLGTAGAETAPIRTVGDAAGDIELVPTSPYVDGEGVRFEVLFERINPDSQTAFEEVFAVRNATGETVELTVTTDRPALVDATFGGRDRRTIAAATQVGVDLTVDTRGRNRRPDATSLSVTITATGRE